MPVATLESSLLFSTRCALSGQHDQRQTTHQCTLRISCTSFQEPDIDKGTFLQGTIELSFNFNGTFWQELVPFDFSLVVLHTTSIVSIQLWCMLRGVWIRMKSNLFRSIEGQTYFTTSWHARMSDPQWTDIECSSFKPPHYLQACTENLPIMEGVVCKMTTSRPEFILRIECCIFHLDYLTHQWKQTLLHKPGKNWK